MLGMPWPDEPSHSQIYTRFLNQVQSAKDDLTSVNSGPGTHP